MSTDNEARGFSLKRWSQRKLAAAREAAQSTEPRAAVGAASAGHPASPSGALQPATSPVAVQNASGPATPVEQPNPVADALPPVESLTLDSDFTAFLRPEIDEGLKRRALKQLFRDPRFNVMDGLDVYIDDYSKPDPIPPDLVRELVQSRYILDPPATRVNARGEVEDVPVEEQAQAGAAEPAEVGATSPAPEAGPAQVVDPTSSSTDAAERSGVTPVATSPAEPALPVVTSTTEPAAPIVSSTPLANVGSRKQ